MNMNLHKCFSLKSNNQLKINFADNFFKIHQKSLEIDNIDKPNI